MPKTKFGIVALLDALGARTTNIQSSITYLSAIEKIHKEINERLKETFSAIDESRRDLFAALNPRFFGDSILLTYEIHNEKNFDKFLLRIIFVLSSVITEGLESGILFRGALAIGNYLENKHIALGPAIVDVASWYEKPDFIGIIATPGTCNYIKAFYVKKDGSKFNEIEPEIGLELKPVPLKHGKTVLTYVLDWPILSFFNYKDFRTDGLAWFYEKIKRSNVLLGTERKYLNTENFVKDAIPRFEKLKQLYDGKIASQRLPEH